MCSLGILRLRSACGYILASYKCNKSVLTKYINSQYKSVARNSNIATEVSKVELINSKSLSEKDKLLFYYENPRFFYVLNGCAIVQFFFWLHLSEFTYKSMKDVKIKVSDASVLEKLPWWGKLDFEKESTRTMVSSFCFLLGYGVMAVAWIFTLRSVRMLVLRKGGKSVSIVTYGPLGRNKYLEVSLEKVSTNQTRATSKSQLPIKVQGKWFYYLLDTRSGVFPNPELFDFTAGMHRTLKK